MPTFTAIALDRLLEPGVSKSVDMPIPNLKPVRNSKPVPNSKPASSSTLEGRNSTSTTERKVNRPQLTPALYATPEARPLPDSPSSFPPSPYIINHKRRGPRLLKSSSVDDVSSRQKTLDKEKVNQNTMNTETKVVGSSKDGSVTFTIPDPIEEEHVNGVHNSCIEEEHLNGVHDGPTEKQHVNGVHDCEIGNGNGELGSSNRELGRGNMTVDLARENDVQKLVILNSERDDESENFFDPQESMSVTSTTEGEDNFGAEQSAKVTTPMGEFFDAWEELSSEGGPHTSLCDIEAELREMRLTLLMEIEKRKQAEEDLNNMQSQWQRIGQRLALLGLTLPVGPTVAAEGERIDMDPADELCQQVYVTRLVSASVGRGIAKAEVELEMEAQIESKNFEIARLLDRLHYYEAMNREMSQRNQEAVEMARRNRQIRKRRQMWVWGSIATVITLGTAALAWSYIPAAKGSSSTHGSQASQHDDASK